MEDAQHPLNIPPEAQVEIHAKKGRKNHCREKSSQAVSDIRPLRPVFRIFDHKSDPDNKKYLDQDIEKYLLRGDEGKKEAFEDQKYRD
jgi:hypothetical protein